MKRHPKPSNVSVAVVDKALGGDISRDELLAHVAELERRVSVYGRSVEYIPAIAKRLARIHRGFSESSDASTVSNQVMLDLGELEFLKIQLKTVKLLEPFSDFESIKKLLRDITE
jgi:hypothetical protein